MNADRRKRLGKLAEQLEIISGEILEIQEEEQAAYDGMPESLQEGERGEKMTTAIDALEEAASNTSNAATDIASACE